MNWNIFNNSGGVKYHLRAVWNRSRWQPFCGFVEAWLNEWIRSTNVGSRTSLVLVGPNAGYTLPHAFINHFAHVVVVEPDPLAYAMFQLRFQRACKWVNQDYFDLEAKKPNPDKLVALFSEYPSSVFLFCNMLGQLPVLLRGKVSPEEVEQYMQQLGGVMRNLSNQYVWASYHDRFSSNKRKPNEVVDHLTGEMFESFPDKKEFPWEISKLQKHQVEFVRS